MSAGELFFLVTLYRNAMPEDYLQYFVDSNPQLYCMVGICTTN